jgi:S-adenosylmethionine-diacylglycerol 3-amino-3-carboxypropyl transferase
MSTTLTRETPPVVAEAPFPLRDRLFWRVFSRTFAFSILYEDTTVEERFFGVDEDATVLSVAAAGCGIAGLLAAHPRRIDAVDGNLSHLALTALKVAASRHLDDHEELYALFGHGVHPDPRGVLGRLSHALPDWAQAYWARNHRMFRKGLHDQSLANRTFRIACRVGGMNADWIRNELAGRPMEERVASVTRRYNKILAFPPLGLLAHSPLPLVAQGINFRQAERNIRSHGASSLPEVCMALLQRMVQTDVERNWVMWNGLGGGFDHDHPECRPPFLRPDRHARAQTAPTHTAFHLGNFLDVLQRAEPGTWSHYSFSDALDWLPEAMQRTVLLEVVRTARPGATLINRTVDGQCLIEQLGLQDHFERLEPASAEATAQEITRLYLRTDLYRVRA